MLIVECMLTVMEWHIRNVHAYTDGYIFSQQLYGKGKKEDELKAYFNEEIEAVSSDTKSSWLFVRYKGI